MPFARVLLDLSNEGYFLDDFWKISLGPPFALFQKMRVLGDFAKNEITWPLGQFWSRFCAKIFSSLCTLSAYNLEVNGICASACGPFKRALFFGRFWKTTLGPPFALFLQNAVLGWPCKNWHNFVIRALLEKLFCLKIFSSLRTLSAYRLDGYAICASAFRPFKRGLLFGRFLKNFP